MSAHSSHWVHDPERRAAVTAKIAAKLRGRPVSPETRTKMRASHLLNPPEADVAAIIRLYAALSLDAVAERVGYHRKVVERVLRENDVAIRPAGFQPGNTFGQARRGASRG